MTAATILSLDELKPKPTAAALFEGARHADGVDVSFFVTDTPPGRGPGLHTHPYPEVFVVLEGVGTFTVGDEERTVEGGHVLVVPPETPHRFRNSGETPLRQVSIHPRGATDTTWLEQD